MKHSVTTYYEKRIMQKIKFIIPVIIISFLSGIALFYISDWKNPEDIIRIEVQTGEYLFRSYSDYTIDFKNNTLTYINSNRVTRFNDEDKKYFVNKANIYGMFHWKEKYIPRGNVYDGSYTNIDIIYNDGSCYTIYCHIKRPLTYDKMREVFIESFGYYII